MVPFLSIRWRRSGEAGSKIGDASPSSRLAAISSFPLSEPAAELHKRSGRQKRPPPTPGFPPLWAKRPNRKCPQLPTWLAGLLPSSDVPPLFLLLVFFHQLLCLRNRLLLLRGKNFDPLRRSNRSSRSRSKDSTRSCKHDLFQLVSLLGGIFRQLFFHLPEMEIDVQETVHQGMGSGLKFLLLDLLLFFRGKAKRFWSFPSRFRWRS